MFSGLDPELAHGALAIAFLVGLPVLGKVVVSIWAIRGASARERPAIIRAVGDMFRVGRRRRDGR